MFINLLSLTMPLLAENRQYVSDKLSIPMRSGVTTGHKILKFLKSGVALDLIEYSEDKKHALVTLVSDNTKQGWVETKLLMPTVSARTENKTLKEKHTLVQLKHDDLKTKLVEAQNRNMELTNGKAQLEGDIQNLQKMLANLRKKAANPIRVARENTELKQQLEDAQAEIIAMKKDNEVLDDRNIKEWFIIGAVVTIGSMIFGIILTRIRWTKKESWANSF